MKKMFLTLIVMVGLLTAVNAQIPKFYDVYSDEAMELVKATPEQRKQVTDQTKDFRRKVVEVKKNTSLSDGEQKAELRKLATERKDALFKNILTPEQVEVLKAKEKERMHERQKAIRELKEKESQQ